MTIRSWRIALISLGLGLLAIGGIVLLLDVAPRDYIGIVTWFAGAIILHDGLLSLGVFATNLVLRRAGRIVPWAVIAIVQGAIVVGGIVTLIVVPQIVKKSIGTTNSTVLPLDYGLNLGLFYAGLLLVTVVTIGLYLRLTAATRRSLRDRAAVPAGPNQG